MRHLFILLLILFIGCGQDNPYDSKYCEEVAIIDWDMENPFCYYSVMYYSHDCECYEVVNKSFSYNKIYTNKISFELK